MLKNTKHIFQGPAMAALWILGALALLVDLVALAWLKGLVGSLIGWFINVLVICFVPFLIREIRGKPVHAGIAFLWCVVAFFIRQALIIEGVIAGHAVIIAASAMSVAWSFLRSPNIVPRVVKQPILPGASPEYMKKIHDRNLEISREAVRREVI